jgi:hypothetical protein
MSDWFYEYNGEAEGPVDERNILRMIENGTIRADTGLWCQGMNDWQPAASVDAFSNEFQQPPPLPANQSYSAEPPPMKSSGGSTSGSGSSHREGEPNIPSHMTKAVLTTLFCCLPLGIVAIVKASGVSSALRHGNYQEARQLSSEAETWANRSIGIGLVLGVIYFFAMLAGA